MEKSYISPKTVKPYYGVAAQSHGIREMGGLEKYNNKIGKDYLAATVCTLALCAYLSRPLIYTAKILKTKYSKHKK